MKIAVLLFGHLRDFELCATSLYDNLLRRYDSDLFIHTWDETEPSTTSWHRDRTRKRIVDESIIHKLKQLYPLKKLVVEHQDKYEDEILIDSKCCPDKKFSNAGIHFMFDTMRKANELRKEYESEKNIKYDYVLVTRPDVKLKKKLDLENVIHQAEILGLDINKCRFYASMPITSSYSAALLLNEPNDLLFFGRPEVIDLYIESNRFISTEFIQDHLINIVSVYTANELRNGITPMPISYSMGYDWSFSRTRIKSRRLSFGKNLLARLAVFIVRPVFYFYRKYEWLNYYN